MRDYAEYAKDARRTLLMLTSLIGYARRPDADTEFVRTVGFALAASMPTDSFPPSYDPTDGPKYPGREW